MAHYGSRNPSQASQLSAEPLLQTHTAAYHNDVELLKRLMAEKAPIIDDESMETPLHVAARRYAPCVVFAVLSVVTHRTLCTLLYFINNIFSWF